MSDEPRNGKRRRFEMHGAWSLLPMTAIVTLFFARVDRHGANVAAWISSLCFWAFTVGFVVHLIIFAFKVPPGGPVGFQGGTSIEISPFAPKNAR
jgi:uncharacterized membrane protein YdjX (TVP38/TMEM64 family)